MGTVFLSLGSNAENAEEMLARALVAIAGLSSLRVLKVSSVYLTEPQGFAAQPWFHNQAAALAAGPEWTPVTLMQALLGIETGLGRVRGPIRLGPRSIDLDMLLYDDVVSDDPVCILPHPRLCRRAFALVPLAEIAPRKLISGKTATEWLAGLHWLLDGRKIFQ